MSAGTTLSPEAWDKVAKALNLVAKGLHNGHLPDRTLICTGGSAPEADMQPLSHFVQEAIAAMQSAAGATDSARAGETP